MKIKSLTKLALSGVALAAVAATLGTSTYAWYVSNTTATVSGAQGSTAGANTAGSLYAATNAMKDNDQWSNNITLASGTDFNTNALLPVTKVNSDKTANYQTATGKTLSLGTAEFANKEGGAMTKDDGAYLEFSYWLISRGGSNAQVTPSLTISNTTSSLSTQKAYSGSYLPNPATGSTPLAAGSTFAVDAVHALRVEITNSAYASTSSASTTSSSVTTYLADRDFETYTTKTGCATPKTTTTASDANLYYDSVVNGVNLYGCGALTRGEGASATTNYCASEVEGSRTPWQSFYLVPDTPTHLTFRIWLEGTDKDCFDSCVGQDFTFSFNFTL